MAEYGNGREEGGGGGLFHE